MTARERALAYLRMFMGLGDRWEYCIPVDGERTEAGVLIDGIEVGPGDDGSWFLKDGEKVARYRKAVSS